MNLQRKAIYNERNAILEGKNLTERIPEIIEDAVEANVLEWVSPKMASDDWDIEPLDQWLEQMTGSSDLKVENLDHDDNAYTLIDLICEYFQDRYDTRAAELAELKGEKMDNSFGSQIRNYVLYPYRLIKDTRSNIESGNVDAALDGDIDQFVIGYHRWRASQ